MWGNITNATKVVAGDVNTLVLKAEGTLWGTGYNTRGTLGTGVSTEKIYYPVQMNGAGGVGKMTDVVSLALDLDSTLILKYDGTVYFTGWNQYGNAGDNGASGADAAATRRYNPVQVKGTTAATTLTDIVSVGVGNYSSFAIDKAGTVYGWGLNTSGQVRCGR